MKKEYPIFEQWYRTLDWILSCVEKFPKNARFSIASRIADISLDAMEKIVEAIYTRNRQPVLNELNLMLEKLRVLFRICHDRRYLSVKQYEHISRAINETGKMVGGWIKANA